MPKKVKKLISFLLIACFISVLTAFAGSKQSFSYIGGHNGYNAGLNKNELYFKKAYALYNRGSYETAAGLFWLYASKGKLLTGYALYYQGICFIKLKKYVKANYLFLRLIRDYPDFAFYKNAVFYLAVSEEKDGYLFQSVKHFGYIAGGTKTSSARSYAIFQIAKIYLRLKDYAKAERYLLQLYIHYPYFSQKEHAAAILSRIPGFRGIRLTRSQKIERALDLFYDSYYTGSLSLLHGINGGSAAFIKAGDLLNSKSPLFINYVNSLIKHAGKINGGYRRNNIRAKLLYLKAHYYYYDLHEQDKTLGLLNYILKQTGYLNKKGASIYEAIVWNNVLGELKNGAVIAARKNLESLITVSEEHGNDVKYLFWYGVVLKKLGMDSKALFYFSLAKNASFFSYYGTMAGIESGLPLKLGNSGGGKTLDLKKALYVFNKILKQNPVLDLHFRRFKLFINLKIYFLANAETQIVIKQVRKITKNHDKRINEAILVSLVDIMDRYGNYGYASELASILFYDNNDRALFKSGVFLKLIYPRPYFAYVNRYASHYGVPISLIYAVMRQESLYNPSCYSSASAIGLMQIIPSTGYYIAGKVRCYNFNSPMLYLKNINIKFGSYYLKTLLEQFSNKKYLAIASYNAGPNAVSYWKRSLFKGDSMLLFIESIPFNQTRNYVKKVLRNYYLYKAIYR